MRIYIAAATAVLLALTSAPAHAADAGDRCSALMSFVWPHLKAEEAQLVPAGPAEPQAQSTRPAAELPEHCLFRGVISPRTGPKAMRTRPICRPSLNTESS